jgi:hypothetical protein
VGAARAGTTSFASYLRCHPDVYMCPVKEPHFFASEVDPDRFRDDFPRQMDPREYLETRPLRPTHCVYIRELRHYEALFEAVTHERAVGEASVSYLYSGTAARRIREASPDARILVLLRNPIDRAYSHYLMDHHEMAVSLSDFVEDVARDNASPYKGWGISNLYVELGLYFEQVKRFLDVFPGEHVKILFFDDYRANWPQAIADVLRFLGIPEHPRDAADHEKLNSARRTARLPSIASSLRGSAIGRIARKLPFELKRTIWTFASRAPEPLTVEVRRELAGYFQDDVYKLSSLVQRDLTHWVDARQNERIAHPAPSVGPAHLRG